MLLLQYNNLKAYTMKIKTIFALAFLGLTSSAFAQGNILNARTAAEIAPKGIEDIMAESDGPMPYQYVNDNDVLYKKYVWETIPLDERANLIYYFPIQDTEDRKSLFTILKDAVMKKEITEVYDYDDFKTRLNLDELKKKFTRIDTADAGVEQINYGEKLDAQYLIENELKPSDVVEYRIKGMWYIDRNVGELRYRLLGIAPVTVDINTKGKEEENYIELFWVFFPDARNILYQNYAYNEKNDVMRSNYDYLFNARKFSATIYKTDNIYDEDIKAIVGENAMFQLLEAERIKDNIRNLEDDM